MPTDSDNLAVYHILQLAEQGRFVEEIAQMLASYALAGEVGGADLYETYRAVMNRTVDLMMDPSEIWEGLLPGPAGQHCDEFTTISMDEFGHLDQARRNVTEIVDIVGDDDQIDMEIVDKLNAYFTAEGLITERPVVLVPGQRTGYEFVVSIIVAPGVQHGETTDLLIFNQKMEAESPLNLASRVITLMERCTHGFPEEEQAAWISSAPEEHWVMTWDQARAIVKLDETKDELDNLAGDFALDWDDLFQAIQDQMVIAGDEYATNK